MPGVIFAATRADSLEQLMPFLITCFLIVVCSLSAQAQVWGLKTHDPVSQPPSTLFSVDPATCTAETIAAVTLNGQQIHVDALAMGFAGELFGFQLDTGSRLIEIDPLTATATVIGAWLPDTQIRGACMRLGGTLLVHDEQAGVLLDIDPSTGDVVGSARPLLWNGLAIAGYGGGDLTQGRNGEFLFAAESRLFSLHAATGSVSLLAQDEDPLPDGFVPWICGLTWLDEPSGSPLYGYEVSANDAVFRYSDRLAAGRETCVDHAVPAYNAGRGDLASAPAGWIEVTRIQVAAEMARIDGLARPGLWVWVEYSAALDSPAWAELPTSLQEAPGAGLTGVPMTWEGLPAPGSQGFYRLRAATELPVFAP